MLRPRIIPCLLVHEGGLVKTEGFKNPKYIGDPINAVKIFNEKEADELIVLDIDATTSSTSPDLTMIANLANECRMPICYGGGIKTAEQASTIIGLGVEKVALSSAAIESPELVSKISQEIGSQSVAVVIDVRKKVGLFKKGYDIYSHNGKVKHDIDLIDFVKKMEALGAGEIIVNSIDRDGKMAGYDYELAILLKNIVKVPLTILGGAGSLDDIKKLIKACGIIGAAAGSLFVFKGVYRAVLINYPTPVQRDLLYINTN